MTFEHKVWESKYRPKKIADTILPPQTKTIFQEMVNQGKVSNCLLSGPGGIGKTTVAYAIASELNADLLYINASLDGNIDTLRTTITQFVTSASMEDNPKIVLLDESDYVTQATQPALRGFLDQFSKNASFIFTCNYPNRIIEPLISRLQVVDFRFTKADKVEAMKQMLSRAEFILNAENVQYDRKSVAALVAKHFPDFRKTIGQLQKFSLTGPIDADTLSLESSTDLDELIVHLKEKNFTKMRQWVANSPVDPATFYRPFYDKILPLLVPSSIPPVILAIAEGQDRSTKPSVDVEIAIVAFLIQIMSTAQFK